MNGYVRYAGSRRRGIALRSHSQMTALAENETEGNKDAALEGGCVCVNGGKHPMRLIDASCKAFFIRRGLDPNGDWKRGFGR
jgi:hypothetical protein